MIPSAQMIYDPLLTWGDKGYASLIPGLATKAETKDNKVWVFHLRKGVKFHNGREMTAQDVKTNFDWRIQTPKGWNPQVQGIDQGPEESGGSRQVYRKNHPGQTIFASVENPGMGHERHYSSGGGREMG
jgi:ABC-type transport system substrate-binding protein